MTIWRFDATERQSPTFSDTVVCVRVWDLEATMDVHTPHHFSIHSTLANGLEMLMGYAHVIHHRTCRGPVDFNSRAIIIIDDGHRVTVGRCGST